MNFICAISADGYMAKGAEDNMAWAGKIDKQIFQLISSLNGGICLAPEQTFLNMPKLMTGRTIIPISRTGLTLETAAKKFPNGLIIGGPTLLNVASQLDLIDDLIVNVVENVIINKLSKDQEYSETLSQNLEQYKFPFNTKLIENKAPVMTLQFPDLLTKIYRLKTL